MADSYFTAINDLGLTLGVQDSGLLPGFESKDEYPASLVHMPEPGTISLLAAGALTLLLARRFHKKT